MSVGINVHLANHDLLLRMADAGFPWVRVDFNMDMIQPVRGQWDWRETDRVMADAETIGLEVYPTLAYAPGWSNGGQGRHVPPTDPADWQHFLATVVARYRAQLTHVSVWNEPNYPHFFAGTVYEYVRQIAAPAVRTLHEIFPSLKVCGPELAMEHDWDAWLSACLSTMPVPFDVIAVHNYQQNGRDTIRHVVGPLPWYKRLIGAVTVRDVLRKTCLADRPIWLTETGFSTAQESEAAQASYYDQVFEMIAAWPEPQRIYFYQHVDEPNGIHWGILRQDLSPKAAYAVCQQRLGGRVG